MCCNNNLCGIVKSDCFWVIIILLVLWNGCSGGNCGLGGSSCGCDNGCGCD